MLEEIKESAEYLSEKTNDFNASVGIVLGTGLGALVNEVDIKFEFNYTDIPHFPISTVESHSGKLIFGEISGTKVVVMQGRFHFYEGYSMSQIVFPIRVMKFLGVKKLFISNAAGGINSSFEKGDIVAITDHINQFPGNPLVGKNIDELGSRFPDMSRVYSKKLLEIAGVIAQKNGFLLKEGIYVGLPGPMLETPAEYKFLGIVGADLVGMSTVPEVIAAKHLGFEIFACSIVTDICYGEIQEANIQEIISTAMDAEPKLTKLVKSLVQAQKD